MRGLDPGPRDPQGYYVVIVSRDKLGDVLRRVDSSCILVEEAGDEVIIRTKSRKIAIQILRLLESMK